MINKTLRFDEKIIPELRDKFIIPKVNILIKRVASIEPFQEHRNPRGNLPTHTPYQLL